MTYKYKNIAISRDNYQKLKMLGTTGDSFNDVISEILGKKVQKKGGMTPVMILGDNITSGQLDPKQGADYK